MDYQCLRQRINLIGEALEANRTAPQSDTMSTGNSSMSCSNGGLSSSPKTTGCSAEDDLLDELGLSRKDLYPGWEESRPKRVVWSGLQTASLRRDDLEREAKSMKRERDHLESKLNSVHKPQEKYTKE